MQRTLLGLMIALLLPVTSWAASFTESFDCSDNASLNCNLTWTEVLGTAWEIFSNEAVLRGNVGSNRARSASATTTDVQYIQGVLQFTTGAGSQTSALHCRRDASVETYYQVQAVNTTGTLRFVLNRVTTGSSVELADDPTDPADNDIIRLECLTEGANARLRVHRNNTLLFEYLDTSSVITGNTSIGIGGFSDTAGQVSGWKSLEYGDIRNSSLGLLGVGQ